MSEEAKAGNIRTGLYIRGAEIAIKLLAGICHALHP